MSNTSEEQLYQFLKALKENLDASTIAYQKYQSNGRKYQFALEIRKLNDHSHELLKKYAQLLPKNLQADAAELGYHYKVWTEKFDNLVEQIPPSPDKEFVFANAFSFPKEAANRLEAAYAELESNK